MSGNILEPNTKIDSRAAAGLLEVPESLAYRTHVLQESMGSAVAGRAVTAKLHVSPNGNSFDGKSWVTAFQTIQEALDAASTDENDCTLILIAPHVTYYDINTPGDPTWAANVILMGGNSRIWAEIRNTHATATSILKLTGKHVIQKLTFNLGIGSVNGIISTHNGSIFDNLLFIGADLTGSATALHIDGATLINNGRLESCIFFGHITHMMGLIIDNVTLYRFKDISFHSCLTAIQIVNADSDLNFFDHVDIGHCTLGLDINAGNEQHFSDINFHHNILNVDDEVQDHIWSDIKGEFKVKAYPQDLVGTTVTANALANVWGVSAILRASAEATKPFRVIGYNCKPVVAQDHLIRFSADGNSTYFDEIIIRLARAAIESSPFGTEYIFNAGTQITASMMAESGGEDTMQVWLKIQEI